MGRKESSKKDSYEAVGRGLKDNTSWREYEDAREASQERVWVQREASLPIRRRCVIPREEVAKVTSDDWAIFALHGNYVRPLRDYEWYPGEPCRIRSHERAFELPPGAAPMTHNSLGHSATAWDPFIFPNPPRSFLLTHPKYTDAAFPSRGSGTRLVDLGLRTAGGRSLQRSRSLVARRMQAAVKRLSPFGFEEEPDDAIDLMDLERQLWFDPEPRWERPYRSYADPKYCSVGTGGFQLKSLVRPGW